MVQTLSTLLQWNILSLLRPLPLLPAYVYATNFKPARPSGLADAAVKPRLFPERNRLARVPAVAEDAPERVGRGRFERTQR